MASATSIRATERRERERERTNFPTRTEVKRGRVRGRFSGALLIGNTLGLILLVFGALGLAAYRDGLIDARTEIVERQAVLARAALSPDALAACGNVNCLIRRAEAERVLDAAAAGFDGRLTLFRAEGGGTVLVARDKAPASFEAQAVPVPDTLPKASLPQTMGRSLSGWLEWLVFEWPLTGQISRIPLEEEAASILAGTGGPGHRLRYSADGELLASVSLPITVNGELAGVVVARSGGIDVVSTKVREALLPIVLLTFGLANFCALTLTAAVTQPLRQLAAAAEHVRSSVGRAGQVKLPDFDHRQDDVGRLSRSFRTMTRALVDRIESIDNFAADVSHELKNPLTSIRSAVETFEKCKTDQQRERLLEVISSDVERMDRLISDISSASRLDAQLATEKRSVLLVSKLVGDVARSYKSVTEAGGPSVNFWDETSSELKIFGGAAALGRVIRNLIDNAVSFSPASGAVTVALEKQSSSGQSKILISVTDEGPGVPPENLESIFDRFYTSRPQSATFGANSGLGLAIARQIIESHGGRIWAENVIHHDRDLEIDGPAGARFYVELPIHRGGLMS